MSDKKDDEEQKADGSLTDSTITSGIGGIEWKIGPATIPYDHGSVFYHPVPTKPIYADGVRSWQYWHDKAKCSKCKKEEEVHTRYNWNDDDKLERVICKKCHTKTMDKLYDLDKNIEAEMTLYDKGEREKE